MFRELAAVVGFVVASGSAANSQAKPQVDRAPFGKLPDGRSVELFTLTNSKGMVAKITNYGGIVVALMVPDRTGHLDDVVLGCDSLEGYRARSPFFGALIGRYGNRIGKAQFTLDGKTYAVTPNERQNHLHGGRVGFDKVLWSATPVTGKDSVGLELRYLSKDAEEGYPGNLSATVTYTLTDANELKIDYAATTDKPTVVNLTHHGYFNLDGAGSGDILGEELLINADRFTPVDRGLIPTGELQPVKGTPMDFTQATAIGARIGSQDEQIVNGGGYDHNWVLNRTGSGLSLAAKLTSPKTGRVMEVLTTEPGLQFYSGNFLDGTITGKGGKLYPRRSGLCLETQHFPDSPNKPSFPSTVLKPGETYKTTTVYRFSTAVQ
jgi:aldose 1-epimerase